MVLVRLGLKQSCSFCSPQNAIGPRSDLHGTRYWGRVTEPKRRGSAWKRPMIKTENSHRTFFNLLAVAGILLSIIAAGCSTTVESQPQAAKAVESGGPMPASVTS